MMSRVIEDEVSLQKDPLHAVRKPVLYRDNPVLTCEADV